MRLRIRSLESKETLKLELPTPCSLQHLKSAIAEKISANSPTLLRISLNRTDELIGFSIDESLKSLGIASGDLIFYTLNPSAFSNPHVQSPLPPQDPNPPKTLEPEPTSETLTLDQDRNTPKSMEPEPTPTLAEEGEAMAVDHEIETPMDEDQSLGIDMEIQIENSSPFPCFLKKVYNGEARDEGSFKLLLVAIHAVFLESGFVGFNSATQENIQGFRLPSIHTGLEYTIPDLPTSGNGAKLGSVSLKFQNLGKFFNVYGSLNQGSGNVYRLCLDKIRFVPSISFACTVSDPNDAAVSLNVKEVFEFWKMVKDGLALPLLIDLCEITGLELPPCFTRLPTELKLKILELLPGVDMAKVGCVSSELKFLSSDNDLWKQKVLKEYEHPKSGLPIDNWKREFVTFTMRKRASLRVKRQARSPRTLPMVHRIGFPSRRGRGPYGFPGVVGGDYDRFPAPFGSNPTPLPGLHFPARRNFSPHCNLGGFDA